MVKLKVLRRFVFGDRTHGSGEVGQVITRTEESAAYLVAYNTDRPIVEVVGGSDSAEEKAKDE